MNEEKSTGRLTNQDLIHQLEERLQGSSEFQNKIDDLSERLYKVNKKLQEAEAFKGHFISNITNEIINPFTSILALSDNIQKLGGDQMDKARKMASLIYNEAFQLDFQLKNIFTAASIESGKEHIEMGTFNLKNLLHFTVSYFSKQMEAKNLHVTCKENDLSKGDMLENFTGDLSKTEMILKNLISNAIKFSYAGGNIEVELTMNDREASFALRDYGRAIPEEKRDEIFDRFKQVDERINSINTGHGLGLSIVQSYCTILNGTIEMEFPDDGGTKVLLKLPVCKLVEDDDLSDFMIGADERF